MDTFTASNGATLTPIVAGGQRITYANGINYPLPAYALDALRQFFRAEEDERLGRWRYDSTIVVYADGDRAVVLDERRPHLSNEFDRRHFIAPEPELSTRLRLAARAYFDAHPEPKPWHDAKPGEVWELTVTEFSNRTDVFYVQEREQGMGIFPVFEAIAPDYPVTFLGLKATVISSARRIYPEEVA